LLTHAPDVATVAGFSYVTSSNGLHGPGQSGFIGTNCDRASSCFPVTKHAPAAHPRPKRKSCASRLRNHPKSRASVWHA
jgi:hypothetical protein